MVDSQNTVITRQTAESVYDARRAVAGLAHVIQPNEGLGDDVQLSEALIAEMKPHVVAIMAGLAEIERLVTEKVGPLGAFEKHRKNIGAQHDADAIAQIWSA